LWNVLQDAPQVGVSHEDAIVLERNEREDTRGS
jgi:hypothetical protein